MAAQKRLLAALVVALLGAGCNESGATEPESFIRATFVVDGADEVLVDRAATLTSSEYGWGCEHVLAVRGYSVALTWSMEEVTGPTALEVGLLDGAGAFLGYPNPTDPSRTTFSNASAGTLRLDEVDLEAGVFEGTFEGVRVEREDIVLVADGEFHCEP